MTSPTRLVVGIDFRTTFTGLATACSNLPEETTVVQEWPGSSGLTSEKVPTEFSYTKRITGGAEESIVSDTLIDYMDSHFNREKIVKEISWGYQVRPQEPRIRCIKLFLDRRKKLPNFVSSKEVTQLLSLATRKVIDAVSDYLAKIHETAMFALVQQYDYFFVTNTPIDFVLTVPAVWSDAAKDATRKAAEQTGFGKRLHLISEPEAAAVYAVKAIQKNGLKVGANIVVCDAGGGTVDLISYRITSIHPLAVEESGVGTGGLCGAAFLNYKFEDYVRTVFGEEDFEAMLKNKPKAWQAAMNNFETYVKRNMDDGDPKEFGIPFPGLVNDTIEDGYLNMTTKEVRDIIFDPIIEQVITLVQDQVSAIQDKDERVTAIVLVGGFGESKYLHARLKSHFTTNSPPAYTETVSTSFPSEQSADAISILRPTHAWTAVVRGAVLRGIQGTIVMERRSRKHYGVAGCPVFDEGKHPDWSKFWIVLMECTELMTKFVEGDRFMHSVTLYESDDNAAPTMRNPSLCNTCAVLVDFSTAPACLFHRKVNSSGIRFSRLSFDLEMTIDSATITFSAKVDGVVYGTVTADFEC